MTSRPDLILQPPGLVGRIAQYTTAAGMRRQPLFGVAAGLVAVASLSRNRYTVSPWNTPLNLYVLLVAESGEGKETPRKVIRECHAEVQLLDVIADHVASGPALVRNLSEHPAHAITLTLDEIGRTIIAARRGSDTHAAGFLTELMIFFGMANSTRPGKVYADTKQNVEAIEHPFVCVLGTSTRRPLAEALSSSDVIDGLLNRFLLMGTVDRKPPFQTPDFRMDHRLKQELVEFARSRIGVAITMPDTVRHRLEEFRAIADSRRIDSGELGPLWVRTFEYAVRVAGVIAAGVKPKAPVIDMAAAEYGIALAQWSAEQLQEMAESEIADSVDDRICKQMLAFIRNPGPLTDMKSAAFAEENSRGWLARCQLTRKFQRIELRRREAALKTLLESGDIQTAIVGPTIFIADIEVVDEPVHAGSRSSHTNGAASSRSSREFTQECEP